MRSIIVLALAATGLASACAADLTGTEIRWLQAAWPLVVYAKTQQLPLDIVVQPQAHLGDAPIAMGFADARCKLVLAMRGNPEAEATLERIPAGLLQPVIEAMVAHELGHCWRYVHGAWHTLPSGFVDTTAERPEEDQKLLAQWRDMRQTRREEGYADLVGLAWTSAHHPSQYAQVRDWFTHVRDDQPVPGAHHDTRVWLRLATDPQAFVPAGTPFEQATPVWQRGLLGED